MLQISYRKLLHGCWKLLKPVFVDLLYLTFYSVFKWNALRNSVTELYPFQPFCSHSKPPAAHHHGLIFIQIMFSSSVYTYISPNASYLQTAKSHCFLLACKAFDFSLHFTDFPFCHLYTSCSSVSMLFCSPLSPFSSHGCSKQKQPAPAAQCR